MIQTTIQNGRVNVPAPANLTDGTRVGVEITPLVPDDERAIRFMTEEEQADDPVSVEYWVADLQALPPVSMTPQQEAELLAGRQKERVFNLEAARREMDKELP